MQPKLSGTWLRKAVGLTLKIVLLFFLKVFYSNTFFKTFHMETFTVSCLK